MEPSRTKVQLALMAPDQMRLQFDRVLCYNLSYVEITSLVDTIAFKAIGYRRMGPRCLPKNTRVIHHNKGGLRTLLNGSNGFGRMAQWVRVLDASSISAG